MIGGKSQEQKVKEQQDKDFQRRVHQGNIQQHGAAEEDGNAAEILRILSNIDDLPIEPTEDAVLGQLISQLTSTANLTPEQVRSNEWVREYILILYLCKQPRKKGMHGAWRGWAHGDPDEALEPLGPQTRMMLESFVATSKLALTRSEDAKVMEESTRTISESVVHDDTAESGGKGGIWGRIKG